MKSDIALLVAVAGLAGRAAAQGAAYAQCGGVNWNGAKNCVSGYTCTYSNAYYSQCLPGGNTGGGNNGGGNNGGGSNTVTRTITATVTTTAYDYVTDTVTETATETATETVTEGGGTCTTDTPPDETPTEPPTTTCDGGDPFQYYGVNEAGAEFGTAFPGRLDKDYTWPQPSSIDFFLQHGFNTFRIPIQAERVAPPATGLSGAFNQTYLVGLYQIVSYIVSNGGYAIIEPHNFGRYNGKILTDVEGFGNFWQNLVKLISWSPNIIYDTMNEFHDMDQSLVWQLNQAAISAIRAAGAANLILVEGNSWTGAWTWTTSGNSDTLIHLYDPLNNMAYEMHQYLDSDGSGTHEECVSDTIGVERLTSATQWCEDNGVKCFLGEIGTGSNDQCIAALSGLLCYLKQSPAWIGVTWWAAGPWWGDYYQSIEPPSGPAIDSILPVLESFL